MGVAMDEAYLLGGWFASALWGAYSVLFGASIYFILTKRRSELNRPTTWIMVLMYSLATAHNSIALRRIVIALIVLRDKPPGPIYYLANIGDNLNRTKDLIYITNLVLGDCVITWRCYAVWAGDLRAVTLPVVMIIGSAIAGYGAIGQYFLPKPSLSVAEAWGTAMFSISLATNVIVTLLTAGRIWYLTRPQRAVLGKTDRRYRTIVLLLIESGAVIAAAKIAEFSLFKIAPGKAAGDHPLYIVFDMMPQITGMMPTLIIAVVNAGLTSTDANAYDAPPSARRMPEPGHIVFRARASGSAFAQSANSDTVYKGVKADTNTTTDDDAETMTGKTRLKLHGAPDRLDLDGREMDISFDSSA